MTIKLSCHCGRVTDCNCSICRRYGVLWAYYSPRQLRFITGSGDTDFYMWGERSIEFHRCKVCGCLTHWAAVDPRLDRMGINARLMEPAVLASARVRKLDAAVSDRYLDEG